MSTANTVTFKKTLAVLEAFAASTGLKFRIEVDGMAFGNLAGAEPVLKKKKFVTSRKYGAITESFRDTLASMKEGELKTLPLPQLPDLNPNHYGSCIAAWCTTNWGKGNYMVSKNGNAVEVMRVK